MATLVPFRSWWKIPRRAGIRLSHRRVTFLELFYDLVYVVIIAELAHHLATHMSWESLGKFAFLFVIVWWAWINGSLYHDSHGNDDIRTRIFTFLQMITVAAMAVFAHDAMEDGSIGFALSYAAFQLILTYLWWRTGMHDKDHRPLSMPYSAVFLLNTILFVVSVFVPTPIRFYLWGIALVLSLILPGFLFILGKFHQGAREQMEITSQATHSLVERFGLFTIIVLGEVVVAVVVGVSTHHHLSWTLGGVSVLGTIMAIAAWWLYFDSVSSKIPKRNIAYFIPWFYLHLPLTLGIAAVGATLVNVIEHTGENLPAVTRLVMVTTLALVLITIAILINTVKHHKEHIRMARIGGLAILVAAVGVAFVGLLDIEAWMILTILVALMMLPIVTAIIAWMTDPVVHARIADESREELIP